MAKWGEGDPRWIVEERPDATNVNNWHWTEKNASAWSVDRIKELFKDAKVESDVASLVINEVEKCEGEASANNRKGKLIFFYEWDLLLKWQGQLNDAADDCKYGGTIKIPNLSEENDVSELDIQVSVKDTDATGDILREIMLKSGKDTVRKQLAQYISSLKEEFSKGMILPKKETVKPDAVKTLSSGFNRQIDVNSVTKPKTVPSVPKIDTKSIELKQDFQCTGQEFFDALTRIEMVTAFTRSAVKIDAAKGGKFELFNGNIHGIFNELVPGKRIVQQWRCKQWPSGHYSIVTFNIDEKSDHTEVVLTQTGIPSAELDATRDNWQRYYWDSIKRAFGFGAFL